MHLVIAGESHARSSGYHAHLKKLVVELGIEQRVLWVGHLSAAELAWCYRECSAFIMSSRVEACPNIGLEALSHGCLLVSTSCPPMPEFFQNAAGYYRAGNLDELEASLMRVLSLPPEEVARQRQLAATRSLDFSWESTAQETVKQLTLAARGEGTR